MVCHVIIRSVALWHLLLCYLSLGDPGCYIWGLVRERDKRREKKDMDTDHR